MNAVDTNIILYSIDQNDQVKQLKARQLLNRLRAATASTVLPWQVLCELGHQVKRWCDQGRLTVAESGQHIQSFRHLFPVVMPTPSVFDGALNLSNRFSLSHWDSLLLAACQDAGITTLYTEDMGAPRTIDGIQLINPVS